MYMASLRCNRRNITVIPAGFRRTSAAQAPPWLLAQFVDAVAAVEAGGRAASAYRCWPDYQPKELSISPTVSALLIVKAVVAPFQCNGWRRLGQDCALCTKLRSTQQAASRRAGPIEQLTLRPW
jgi:hypothetical protein